MDRAFLEMDLPEKPLVDREERLLDLGGVWSLRKQCKHFASQFFHVFSSTLQ